MLLDRSAVFSQGSPMWCARKKAEAKDCLALSQVSPRFKVLELDMRESLRLFSILHVAVPRFNKREKKLRVVEKALLGIYYPEESMRKPLPGYVFVQIIQPFQVWHANVTEKNGQLLCLGSTLPAGIFLREIIIMAYSALSMQSIQIDEKNHAGVMNVEAARWWQKNSHRIPLTEKSFLSPIDEG